MVIIIKNAQKNYEKLFRFSRQTDLLTLQYHHLTAYIHVHRQYIFPGCFQFMYLPANATYIILYIKNAPKKRNEALPIGKATEGESCHFIQQCRLVDTGNDYLAGEHPTGSCG